MISCVIFITNSLKTEYTELSKDFPDILVQRYYGGKVHFIDQKLADEFKKFPSVSPVQPRIWGEYYFGNGKIYTTIFGIQSYTRHFTHEIDNIAQDLDEAFSEEGVEENYMITSKNLYEFLSKYTQTYGSVPFFTPKGEIVNLVKAGEFKSGNSLMDNDIILMSEENAREILGIPNGFYSDIVLEVSNKKEAEFSANKIRQANPDLRVITKEEILKKYEFLYDFKSGWFLALLITCAATFSIILYDKSSGIRSEEKREIAILKAVGWDISDIIKFKLTEATILSVLTFFIALSLAIFYVYILKAPILSDVFTGFSNLKLDFDLIFAGNFKVVALLFFLTVPLYVGVSIIPSFKVATKDIGEMIK